MRSRRVAAIRSFKEKKTAIFSLVAGWRPLGLALRSSFMRSSFASVLSSTPFKVRRPSIRAAKVERKKTILVLLALYLAQSATPGVADAAEEAVETFLISTYTLVFVGAALADGLIGKFM